MGSFVAHLSLLLLISMGQVYGGKVLQRRENHSKAITQNKLQYYCLMICCMAVIQLLTL